MVVLGLYSIKSINNGLNWKKAFAETNKDMVTSLKDYKKISNPLKHDRSFVMNYGSILFQAANYEKCIDHYEKRGYLCACVDQFVMLGESYEKIKNYRKAEENYKNASFLVPHKFIPKYRLFKLYQLTRQNDKTYQSALEIRKMKIKIYSEPVKQIKTEANEYLSTHDTK